MRGRESCRKMPQVIRIIIYHIMVFIYFMAEVARGATEEIRFSERIIRYCPGLACMVQSQIRTSSEHFCTNKDSSLLQHCSDGNNRTSSLYAFFNSDAARRSLTSLNDLTPLVIEFVSERWPCDMEPDYLQGRLAKANLPQPDLFRRSLFQN